MRILGLTVTIGLALVAVTSGTADTTGIPQLIRQLGSDRCTERDSALQALEALGPAALPALRLASHDPDLEIRRRAEDLIGTIALRVDSARLIEGKHVRLSFQDKPVAEAIADFNRLTGAALHLAPGQRAWVENRTITLHTEDVSYWRALDQFCAGCGLTIQPGAEGNNTALVVGPLPSMPECHAGALRIRALPTRSPGWGQTPGVYEVPCSLEIASGPGLCWHGVLDLRIRHAVDDHGQDLEAVANGDADFPEMAGSGRDVRMIKGLGLLQRDELARAGEAAQANQQVTVRLKLARQPSHCIREIRGTLVGRMETPPETLVRVPDILKAADQTVTGQGGCILKMGTVSRDERDVVKIDVEYQSAEPPLDVLAIGAPVFNNRRWMNQLILWQFRSQNRTVPPPNFELRDGAGRTFEIIRYNEANHVDGSKAAYSATLHCFPKKDVGAAAQLVLIGRRTVMVEVPFTLKNVPLP